MTDHLPLAQHTDDTLTELYDQLEQARAELAQRKWDATRQANIATVRQEGIARLRAELEADREENARLRTELERAEAERDQHAAQIAAVRELHRKASHGTTCVYCAPLQRIGYDTDWPCDTIRALDTALASPAQPRSEPTDTAEGSSEPRVIAYRSPGGRILRCLRHVPRQGAGLQPVTAGDLDDGGICTHPDCGVDVLATEGSA